MTSLSPAQRKLVIDNKRLIGYYKGLHNTRDFNNVPKEDVENILAEGLCRAAKKYNPKLGFSFATYALKVMRNWLIRSLRDYQYKPSASKYIYERSLNSGILELKRQDNLSVKNIVSRLNCSTRAASDIKAYITLSVELSDAIELYQRDLDNRTPDEIFSNKELYYLIRKYCAEYVKPKFKPAFYRYYGLGEYYNRPMTMKDISKELDVPFSTIQNRIYKSVNRLGQAIGDKLDFYV